MNFFKRRNLFLVLALVLALLLAITVAIRLRSVSQVAELVRTLPSDVELKLQDVNYTHSEAGLVRWRLRAERAERLVADRKLAVENPEVTFYDETGTRQMVLTAETGEADEEFSELHVRGDVVVESSHGYQLFAEQLVYKQQDEKIYSDSQVEFLIDDVIVKGHGLVLDIGQRTVAVLADVSAVLPVTRLGKALQ